MTVANTWGLSWVFDIFAPKRKTFVVNVNDSHRNQLTDVKVQLFVQRYSTQVPYLVAETSETSFSGAYLLNYSWHSWFSDEDVFGFTIKAVKAGEVLKKITLYLESSKKSERVDQRLTLGQLGLS